MTLAQLKMGEYGTISSIDASDIFKRRLFELGFLKDCMVRIIRKAPFNGPVVVEIKGYSLTLRKNDAKKIMINKI